MENSRTWIELSRDNVLHNVGTLRGLVDEDGIMCSAVKANAYGHGMKEISPLILEGGAEWLGVDSLAEAVELRESGVDAEIYIMGHIPLDELEIAVKGKFHFVVHNPETLEKLKEVTKKLQMPALTHLKLETGTNRQGVLEADLADIMNYYREEVLIVLEGVAMHFADIEDTTDHSYAAAQSEQFKRMIQQINGHGFNPKYQHNANSAATILFPHSRKFVRPGIANYGMWPSKETLLSARQLDKVVDLKPVLTWKAKIAGLKSLEEGSAISYGRTYKTTRKSKVAIIPVGYYDGLPRCLSTNNHVLVKGRRAPIVGRVMMNMTVIDVTDIPDVQLEDEVVIIGTQGEEKITAEDIAERQGTINYEVTTQIREGIKRIVV